MNRRIIKECRSLLLPWAAGASAAICLLLALMLHEGVIHIPVLNREVLSFLISFSVFVLCASIPLLAAMSLGTEYQQRTLPLLLAQPCERARLWKEKMIGPGVAVASVAMIVPAGATVIAFYVFGYVPHLTEPDSVQSILLIGTAILATVCSTGFWTMVARSTIGGLVFSISVEFIVVMSTGFVLQQIYGDLSQLDSIVAGTMVTVGLVYSAVLLWLGRRKFAALQLREVSLGEGFAATTITSGLAWRPALLRCRPQGSLLNLVRKEFRLQKTVFVIVGVLFLCWAITLVLSFAAPIRKDYLEGIFGGITAIYAFLVPVLAGTISLGEEVAIGLTAWHLTLPVSARVQWLIKLLVSAVVAVGLGVLLPTLLLNLTAMAGKVDLLSFGPKSVELPAILMAIGAPFLLGFWAVTFLGNTVKAVVATVIGVGVLGSLCGLGVWCASHFSGMAMLPVSTVIAWLQLPVFAFNQQSCYTALACFSVVVVALAALVQSLIQFRRAQSRPWTLAKNAAILAALVLVCSGLSAAIADSVETISQTVSAEMDAALNRLPFKESDFAGQNKRVITVQDLDRTGSLSWATKTWLRNASITVSLSEENHQHQRAYQAMIMFPNGSGFEAASDLFPATKLQNRYGLPGHG